MSNEDPSISNFVKKFFPLRQLPKKIKRRVYRDIIKKENTVIQVLDFSLLIPLQMHSIGLGLMIFGHRELDQYHIMKEMLNSNDTVLDIGSNIGYYCVIEGKIIGSGGHIYAFEPDPRNLEYLVQNVNKNNLAQIVEISSAAISNSSGDSSFEIAEHGNLNSIERTRCGNSDTVIARKMNNRRYIGKIAIQTVDFCAFLESAQRTVDFVRMDVEGYEVQILGSLADRLEREPDFPKAPRTIVFEPHSWEYCEGHDLMEVIERLMKQNYRITRLGSRHEPDSPMHRYGYTPQCTFLEERGFERGVYTDISQEDALELASRIDGVTTVCLQRI